MSIQAKPVAGMTARIERITPAIAKDMIASTAIRQRTINRGNVEAIKRAIRAGQWTVNGEAIKLDVYGNLLDGQHRLTAVVETGITIETFVVRNVGTETFTTIDTGRMRRSYDVLGMIGEADPMALSAAIRIAEPMLVDNKLPMSRKTVMSADDQIAFLELFPGIRQYASMAMLAKSKGLARSLIWGTLFFIGERTGDHVAVQEFGRRVLLGHNLDAKSPEYALREYLLSRKAGTDRDRNGMVVTIIRGWNAHRKGRSVSRLQSAHDNVIPEVAK